MATGIYLIHCETTGQAYVGTAIHWEKRISRHVSKLKLGIHKNQKLQHAWNTHGAENFNFKLLEECEVAKLLQRERFWAHKLKTIYDGFNSSQTLGSNGMLRHGQTGGKTYKSWDAMKQRCTNPNSPDYIRYGAAGVTVCQRWLDSFENFFQDMGERPEGTTLDRFPNNKGNYEPNNSRWATPLQQQRNLSNNQYLTIEGETKLLVDWATEKNMPVDLLRKRILANIPEGTLFAPSYSRYAGAMTDGTLQKRFRNESKNVEKYSAFGKTQTLTQWAAELGVERGTLAQRIQKYKMPLEKALVADHLKRGKEGPRTGHRMITAFGKTKSLTAWSRETGISVSTLKNRIGRANMHPEEALVAPLYAQQSQPRKERN